MPSYRIIRSIYDLKREFVSLFFLSNIIFCVLCSGCTSLRKAGCDEILSVNSAGSPQSRVHHVKGVKHFDHGKLPAAAKAFERAIELDYNNGSAHNNLGMVYYQQRRLSDAAAEFGIATRLLPEDATPWNNLGMTLEAAGRGLESLEYYARAYEIAPAKPLYLGNLVRTRIRLGETDESVIEQLKELQFIETRPDWIEWINDQLALNLNPYLDRGPAPANLSNSKSKSKSSDPSGSPKGDSLPLSPSREPPVVSPPMESELPYLMEPSGRISDVELEEISPQLPNRRQ